MNIGFDREDRFLGAALRFHEFEAGMSAGLEVDDFTTPHFKALWSAMVAVGTVDGGRAVDVVSVGEELARRGQLFTMDAAGLIAREFLLELSQSATSATAEMDARKIREAGLARRAAQSGERVIHDVLAGEASMEDLRAWAAGVARSLQTSRGLRPVNAAKAAQDFLDREVERRVIRSGIEGLDLVIGGFPRGSLVTVAGLTSHGKSALMADMSRAAALRQERVAFFSVEMSEDETAARTLSAMTGVVGTDALLRGEREESWWPHFVKVLGELAAMQLDIFTTPSLSLEAVEEAVEVAAEPYDLVVVDYLQIMVTPKAQSRNEAIGVITAGLKRLAMKMDGVVILGSQLNRVSSRENREPALHDLRDSGSIEQDSNIVLFVHQPDQSDDLRNLIVAKNRNGRKGRMPLPFYPERCSFIRRSDG